MIDPLGMEMIVLRPEDFDVITLFERNRLQNDDSMDEMEKQLSSWHARWRQESLEHYLNVGWSFGIWDDTEKSNLLGYVLCQPLLFLRGYTQTLWLEHLSYSNDEVGSRLIEIAYRWSRDKHLQQLIFPKQYDHLSVGYNTQPLKDELCSIDTTKLRK